jgi:AraC-like DNA-binding protein
MIDPCPPRFERHTLARFNALERARAHLSGYGFGFDVAPGDAAALDLRLNSACLGNTAVIHMRTGAAAALTQPDDEVFWIVLPVHAGAEASIGGEAIDLGPTRGAVLSARQSFALRTTGAGVNFAIGVREPVLRRRLAGLLGEEPSGALAFAPGFALDRGNGSRFVQQLQPMIADFFDGGPMFHDPLHASAFEDLMLTELLLGQPHSHAGRLGRLQRSIDPRAVRRATDYIEAHLDLPLTVGEVSAVAGVAGRTLHKHFQDARGTTPMQYVRARRFAAARRALLAADRADRVTEIALRWGFSHLGRFAVEYRKRYGETPSQTLRRRQPGASL